MNSKLFSPLKLRELIFKNRIVVSPMCQYSAVNGIPNNWHLVHLGSRAVGGAALIMAEATAVSPEGRISPSDLGIWSEAQVHAFKSITEFIKNESSIPGIQIAHAGRKASTRELAKGSGSLTANEGGWTPIAPSAVRFNEQSVLPKEMTSEDISQVCEQFAEATKNSLNAGFEVVEIHMAHGYLLNEFLSPLTNFRKDTFGGSIENRMRFPLQVAKRVRELWPQDWPVFVRISATDWRPDGWSLDDSVQFSKKLKELGIDLIDCSSGGSVENAKIKSGPGYQVPFSELIREKVDIATAAVGMITEPEQADEIIKNGKADLVFLARELLRNPYWPLHAAQKLKSEIKWPKQYDRAKNLA